MDCVVVTVTYRGGAHPLHWAHALQRAWNALPPAARGDLQVLAVDNASQDGTAERLRQAAPWLTVIESPKNLGFAAACNLALRTVDGDETLVAIVNPDLRVREDFFQQLSTFRWPADLAAIGPQIRAPNGEVEQSARAFPSVRTGILGRTSLAARLLPDSRVVRDQLLARPAVGEVDVDWVSGACLITRTDMLRRVGLLSEEYRMYWEDADWCKRAYQHGLHVRYLPTLVAEHHQGSSSASHPFLTTVWFHQSAYRYYRRHVARTRVGAGAAGMALTARCFLKLLITAIRR